MTVGQACLWGLVGVALVEVYGLWSAAGRGGAPRWPWRDARDVPRVDGYAVAVACRAVMGAGLNAVYAAAHQTNGPLAAVTIGIAAPLIIQHMAIRTLPDAPAAEPALPDMPALGLEAIPEPQVGQGAGGPNAG